MIPDYIPKLVNFHGVFDPQKPLSVSDPDFMRQIGEHSTGGYPMPQAPWMQMEYVPDFMSLGGLGGGCCGWDNVFMKKNPKTGLWFLWNEGRANPAENFIPKGKQKFSPPPFGLGQTFQYPILQKKPKKKYVVDFKKLYAPPPPKPRGFLPSGRTPAPKLPPKLSPRYGGQSGLGQGLTRSKRTPMRKPYIKTVERRPKRRSKFAEFVKGLISTPTNTFVRSDAPAGSMPNTRPFSRPRAAALLFPPVQPGSGNRLGPQGGSPAQPASRIPRFKPAKPELPSLSGDYYSIPGAYSSLGGAYSIPLYDYGLGEVDQLYKEQMTADIIGYRSQVAKVNSVNAVAVYAHGLKLQKQLLELKDWSDSSWFCVQRAGAGGYCTKLFLSEELDKLLNQVNDKYGPFDINSINSVGANDVPQKDKSIVQKASELTASQAEKDMIRREEEQIKIVETQRAQKEVPQLLAKADEALARDAKTQAVDIYKEVLSSHGKTLSPEQKKTVSARLDNINKDLKTFAASQEASAALIQASQQEDAQRVAALNKLMSYGLSEEEKRQKIIAASAIGGLAVAVGLYLYYKR